MKRVLLSLTLSCTLLFSNSECPNLDIENSDLNNSKEILKELNNLEWAKRVYTDILKKYIQSNDIESFASEESVVSLGKTQIYGTLIAYYYSNDMKNYNRVLDTISPENPDWCNATSFNTILTNNKRVENE